MLKIQKTQNNTRSSAYLESDKPKISEHRLKSCACIQLKAANLSSAINSSYEK